MPAPDIEPSHVDGIGKNSRKADQPLAPLLCLRIANVFLAISAWVMSEEVVQGMGRIAGKRR